MVQRRLSAEEQALWAQVAASTKPIAGRKAQWRVNLNISVPLRRPEHGFSPTATPPPQENTKRPNLANTLDANWDKRLSKGSVRPDYVIDLHEHSAASAHARLDQGLANALAAGARIVLLITGKPRGTKNGHGNNPRMPPTSRGVIRASVDDWLAGSRWSGSIAAIRNAHPRHGGAGALYLIMRRPR